MIDWISCKLPLRHVRRLQAGVILEYDASGELTFTKYKPTVVEGSHSSKMIVRTEEQGHTAYVSGNFVKFLQGHNLFGTDDLNGLVTGTMERVCEVLDLTIDVSDHEKWLTGDQTFLTRTDCTKMYQLPKRNDVDRWLHAAGRYCTARYRGRPEYDRGTVIWGKHSRRSTKKFYSKGRELEAHPLPLSINHSTELYQYAWDKLRSETCYRGIELKRLGLQRAAAWSPDTSPDLHQIWLEKLNLGGSMRLEIADLDKLKRSSLAAYRLWLAGDDVAQIYSKAQYHRHKKLLLEHGIDIGAPVPEKSDVLPLMRVVEAVPVGVPEWAKGTDVYFDPARVRQAN